MGGEVEIAKQAGLDDPRRGDQPVDPSVPGRDCGDGCLTGCRIGDIDRQEIDARWGPERGGGIVQPARVAGQQGDVVAAPEKCTRWSRRR